MSIEQKIAEILAESRKKQLDEANPATKNAEPGDQKPIHKGPTSDQRSKEVKPTGSGNTPAEHSHLLDQGSHEANPDNARAFLDHEDNLGEEGDEGEVAKTDVQDKRSSNPAARHAVAGDKAVVRKGDAIDRGDEEEGDGPKVPVRPSGKVSDKKDHSDQGIKEDIDAMLSGEELSEEFKTKAATIFEAAVMSRVNAEVARLEEEFEASVAQTVAEQIEGIVEQVDGYLGYIAEQWMAQNEIALERGVKNDILESFVDGLKGLFEEHYIDIPEEKYDLLGEMEETISELEAKINEQVAANVELTKVVSEAKRNEIVASISEGLTATETEKFNSLVNEIAFEDSAAFETKVKTIRESYFTKTTSGVKSVVTDSPVEVLTESGAKVVDAKMSAYLSVLNNK
jgi:hypothetical protein